jgi:AraC-like DNA-binding protein
MLVTLLRWEESVGKSRVSPLGRANWSHIQKALHYIHEHHTEPIYVRQIAQELRVGERQLNGLFRQLLGMSCIQYLNEYRVSLATAMLSTSAVPVTTAAFNVGFETLSHFNTTFHKVVGMSPTEYIGRKKKAG